MSQQRTVASDVVFAGVGVHSGQHATVRLAPAAPDHGLQLELPGGFRIAARVEHVQRCVRGVTLGMGTRSVASVEHLLAALGGVGVTNAVIHVDGPEVPVLDGSALPFVEGIRRVGVVDQPGTMPELVVRRRISVVGDGRSVDILPAREFLLDVEVSYQSPRVGRQRYAAAVTPDRFEEFIAPARTFGFLVEACRLRSEGFCHGASLDNSLVMDGSRVLSPPLRFRDEVVRHKALDLLGDLVLLEYPLRARVVAHKAGHAMHMAALRELLARPECWELMDPGREVPWTVHPYGSEGDMAGLCAG